MVRATCKHDLLAKDQAALSLASQRRTDPAPQILHEKGKFERGKGAMPKGRV